MAYDFSKLKEQIRETEEWLSRELTGVRTGRATPTLLDGVKTDAYGTKSSLRDIASISVEDARTLRIIPWDKGLMKAIEKAIVDSNLGVGVSTDDQGIRVSFPELTSERRTQLAKIAGDKTEQARITLRTHRADAIKELDSAEKEGGIGKDEVTRLKGEVQKLIDSGNETLANAHDKKVVEISE